jgi:hypothetical protein
MRHHGSILAWSLAASMAASVLISRAANAEEDAPLLAPHPDMAMVMTAEGGRNIPPVLITSIDGTPQERARTGFLHLFVSSDPQSYELQPGLHQIDVQHFGYRTVYLNHVRVLLAKNHRYKFFFDGEELKFQDVTIGLARNISLRPEILTGAQKPTIVINIIRPTMAAPSLGSPASPVTAANPIAEPAMTYDQWMKVHSQDGGASSPPSP